jgi:carboxyl-terminal processing protease
VGSPVTLGVLHQGETEIVELSLVREQISVPSVTWTMAPGTTFAHVLVSEFADHSSDELVRALQAARAAGATGVVLDLRNDPGGLRDEAIAVASQFLKDGTVVIEQDAGGHRTFHPVKGGGVAVDLPLVVLVNEGTASSAEIVAGAIKDHRRAELVGSTTFGTGTVLTTYPLADGSALLLGTTEWLTPNGDRIWHHGIAPDVAVDLPPTAVPLEPTTEAGLTPDQLRANADAQLLRALQELQQGAPGP